MRVERAAGTPVALGMIFGSVLAVGACLAMLWLYLELPRPVCHFRSWTGVPCPTCGTTRMVERLLSGDVAGALGWNPLVFIALTAVAVWGVVSAMRVGFGLPAWRLVLERRDRAIVRVLAILALFAGWGYLIWRGV